MIKLLGVLFLSIPLIFLLYCVGKDLGWGVAVKALLILAGGLTCVYVGANLLFRSWHSSTNILNFSIPHKTKGDLMVTHIHHDTILYDADSEVEISFKGDSFDIVKVKTYSDYYGKIDFSMSLDVAEAFAEAMKKQCQLIRERIAREGE